MWLFLFALWFFFGDEKSMDKLFFLTHVTKGGCLDEYEAVSKKCHRASPADDPDACIKAKAALHRCFGRNPEWFFGHYYDERPEWFLPDEWKHEKAYVMFHVANGGCLDEFRTAMDKCRDGDDDAEACVEATAALRKCLAGEPDWFARAYFMDRLDKGLDQDTKPAPEEIEKDERRGTYRWWTGMRRT